MRRNFKMLAADYTNNAISSFAQTWGPQDKEEFIKFANDLTVLIGLAKQDAAQFMMVQFSNAAKNFEIPQG